MKSLFEDTSSRSTESAASSSDDSTNTSRPACFTAPPPPPPSSIHQQHPPAPPFPSRVSPYVIPTSSPVDTDLCLPDLGRHQIGLLEKLGEGSFGALHFAELDVAGLNEHLPGCGTGSGRRLVLMRLIRTSANNGTSKTLDK